MRTVLLTTALCTLCAVTPAWADTGDIPSVSGLGWGRLQGRVAFATHSTSLRSEQPAVDSAFKVGSVSLMGDYYLRPSLNQLTLSGLRATSGVVFGQRSSLWGVTGGPSAHGISVDRRHQSADIHNHADHATTPYVGIGYSGGGSSRSSSWGFTADLGLMSLSPGNVNRLGKVMNGSQNLDDLVRDLRLSPVLQLGFSYAF